MVAASIGVLGFQQQVYILPTFLFSNTPLCVLFFSVLYAFHQAAVAPSRGKSLELGTNSCGCCCQRRGDLDSTDEMVILEDSSNWLKVWCLLISLSDPRVTPVFVSGACVLAWFECSVSVMWTLDYMLQILRMVLTGKFMVVSKLFYVRWWDGCYACCKMSDITITGEIDIFWIVMEVYL